MEEVVSILFQSQGFPSPMTPGQGAAGQDNRGRNRLGISQLSQIPASLLAVKDLTFSSEKPGPLGFSPVMAVSEEKPPGDLEHLSQDLLLQPDL